MMVLLLLGGESVAAAFMSWRRFGAELTVGRTERLDIRATMVIAVVAAAAAAAATALKGSQDRCRKRRRGGGDGGGLDMYEAGC